MSIQDRLQKIILRYTFLTKKLCDTKIIGSKDYITLAKEQKDLTVIYELIVKFNKLQEMLSEIEELSTLINVTNQLYTSVENEKKIYKKKIEKILEEIKTQLIKKDNTDQKGVILEIRAGAGGNEAALFCMSLFNMYKKYTEKRGWRLETISSNYTNLNGFKEKISYIHGNEVYKYLKYESGVHRVQRIPQTESNDRIHTSTATVAILLEPETIDLVIEDKDLRIDSFRGSGAGGQHVNTTDSAIRITHIPTGISVIQAEKSQHQNKAKAMKILRSRIYELERKKTKSLRAKTRRSQIGTGDRSEKIRTYNYPQNRITDHRIQFTSYNLDKILSEGALDTIIHKLIANNNIKQITQNEE